MSDNLEIADPNDFFVERDEDDNLQAVEQKMPGVEQALNVVPMTIGEVNRYDLEGEIDVTDEELAEIFSDHLGDLDRELSADDVSDNMLGFGKEAVLQTILRASGHDLHNALQLENLEVLDELDEGKLEMLMGMADA